DEKLLNAATPSFVSSKSIFIAGGKEGEVMERTAKALYSKLNQQQDEKTRIFYEFLEDKDHGDALHIAVYHAFEKIFGSQKNTQ
ncbi:MAG TPA: esterase, partial [Leeuwenhoekiella sp.]|nr:esterase [Leeuwenhoekiella sp.]